MLSIIKNVEQPITFSFESYLNPIIYIENKEPYGYFYPPGQDNTLPLDETNLVKKIPKYGCKNTTKMLVGIRSSPNESIERDWIRNNWGNYKSENTAVIFLVANSNNDSINMQISEEEDKFEDILLMNFDDHYRNLSLKNYVLFKYYLEHCTNAKCLLKPDIDTVTNILGFEKMCDSIEENVKMISCCMMKKQKVIRIVGNKWYVPKYVFPKEEYESWAWGWGYLMSGKNTVQDLVDTLRTRTPFLHSENYRRLPDDAIQMGDVRVMANISIQNSGGFNSKYQKLISTWKDPKTNVSYPLIVNVKNDKEEVWEIVKKILMDKKIIVE